MTSIRRARTFFPIPRLKKHRGTRPVGCYPANDFELYDMSGNVWEWVADWYRADTYRDGESRNPRGPASGALRIVRGGSWVTHDVSAAEVRASPQGASRHLRV